MPFIIPRSLFVIPGSKEFGRILVVTSRKFGNI